MYLGQILSIVIVVLIALAFAGYYLFIFFKKPFEFEYSLKERNFFAGNFNRKRYIYETNKSYVAGLHRILNYFKTSKLRGLYLGIGIFILVYVLYCFFALPLPTTEVNLYQPDLNATEVGKLGDVGRTTIGQWDTNPILIFYIVAALFLIILTFVLGFTKRLSPAKAVLILLLLGIIVRLCYGTCTDAIFTRQHDNWTNYYYGHYGITMHIYTYGTVPELRVVNGEPSLDWSYQFYHPKYAHYLYAIGMHINEYILGTSNTFTLYQSIRIYTISMSIGAMLFGYFALKHLIKKEGYGLVLATMVLVSAPFLIRMSPMTNNDPALWFFAFATIYFAVRFYENVTYFNSIAMALSIGLAIGSKQSGAFLAIPIGIMMIYKLIGLIKERKWLKILGIYGVFAIIAFPVGLFWIVYNYIYQGQPITYIWANLNQNLLVDESYTFAQRFLAFPVDQYFKSVFNQLWVSSIYGQDYNLWTTLMKSNIFGEFSNYTGIALYIGLCLYVTNFIMMIAIFAGFIFMIAHRIIRKQFSIPIITGVCLILYCAALTFFANSSLLWLAVIIGLMLIAILIFLGIKFKTFRKDDIGTWLIFGFAIIYLLSFIYQNVTYPYTCSMDFRYLAIFYLFQAYITYLIYEEIQTMKGVKTKKVLTIITILVVVIYSTFSYGLYLTTA